MQMAIVPADIFDYPVPTEELKPIHNVDKPFLLSSLVATVSEELAPPRKRLPIAMRSVGNTSSAYCNNRLQRDTAAIRIVGVALAENGERYTSLSHASFTGAVLLAGTDAYVKLRQAYAIRALDGGLSRALLAIMDPEPSDDGLSFAHYELCIRSADGVLAFTEITQSLQLFDDGVDGQAVICDPRMSNALNGKDMRYTVGKLVENVERPTVPETSPAVDDHMVVAEETTTFESAALMPPPNSFAYVRWLLCVQQRNRQLLGKRVWRIV